MGKSITTKEIQFLLEAINEQFEIIREYDDFIPQIEFDMIMENVRKLYETFHRLQRLNDPMRFVERKDVGRRTLDVGPEVKGEGGREKDVGRGTWDVGREEKGEGRGEKEVGRSTWEVGREEKEEGGRVKEEFGERTDAEAKKEPEIPQPAPSTHHPAPSTQHPSPSIPHPSSPIPQPPIRDPKPAIRRQKEAELDLFTSEEQAFSSKLKEAREKSLGPKISRHDSLKASIGINDKFMFINDLFDGNLREYNEFIEKLGGFTTLPSAIEFLDLAIKKNDWAMASNALKRLQELLVQRF